MAPCARTCKLRPEFDNLTLDEQLAMLRGCHEADLSAYMQCAAKQRALAKWIELE